MASKFQMRFNRLIFYSPRARKTYYKKNTRNAIYKLHANFKSWLRRCGVSLMYYN